MTVHLTRDPSIGELPSTVDLVVTWLKGVPEIQALVGTRISTTLPVDDDNIVYPWLTVARVVGVPTLPEGAIDRARITFNAWGGVTTSGAPYWPEADALIRAVEREIRATHVVVVPGKGVIIALSNLEGIQQLVDPDTNGARFWMDSRITARKE